MEILRTPVTDPSAWVAENFRVDPSWLHTLSDGELAELDSALLAVKGRGLAPPHFSRDDFHIPRMTKKPRPWFRSSLKRLSCEPNRGM